jgi:PiT family inorganic phosphate transporter
MPDVLLVVVLLAAVGFDFTNGFHDTANAIATSISTRALSPRQAVLVAAVLNLAGAIVTVAFFQAKVSNTIAKLVSGRPGLVLLLAALLGAITWNLITWYLGLPSSSTHAIVGGLAGAAAAHAGGFHGIHWGEFWKVVVSLVTSPPVGFLAAGLFTSALLAIIYRMHPGPLNRGFRRFQILTSMFLSYSHGANDAQKTMAVMTMALIAAGHLSTFKVPLWVVAVSGVTIGFGTYAGGWRIIRTLGWRIFKLDPASGMSAQLMGAAVIQVATQFGLPVSTTHVITGSVMGTGAARRLSELRWTVGANIISAWIFTIPAAGLTAWVLYAIMTTAGLHA